MAKYIMKCGHADNAHVRLSDGSLAPACVICTCTKIDKKITTPTMGLEGRKASCNTCGHETNSNWNLPFFKYEPQYETDSYYCGCRGWD